MSSKIEVFLYRGFGTHGLKQIAIASDTIDLALAPWTELDNVLAVKFKNCRLGSIRVVDDDPDDWNMPWDIIAIDCEPRSGQWAFCLYAGPVELNFVADWPIPVSSR